MSKSYRWIEWSSRSTAQTRTVQKSSSMLVLQDKIKHEREGNGDMIMPSDHEEGLCRQMRQQNKRRQRLPRTVCKVSRGEVIVNWKNIGEEPWICLKIFSVERNLEWMNLIPWMDNYIHPHRFIRNVLIPSLVICYESSRTVQNGFKENYKWLPRSHCRERIANMDAQRVLSSLTINTALNIYRTELHLAYPAGRLQWAQQGDWPCSLNAEQLLAAKSAFICTLQCLLLLYDHHDKHGFHECFYWHVRILWFSHEFG